MKNVDSESELRIGSGAECSAESDAGNPQVIYDELSREFSGRSVLARTCDAAIGFSDDPVRLSDTSLNTIRYDTVD